MNVGCHEMSPLRAANNPFVMVVPFHCGFRVTPPTVRANLRTRFHILIQKAADSFFLGILNDSQSQSPRFLAGITFFNDLGDNYHGTTKDL